MHLIPIDFWAFYFFLFLIKKRAIQFRDKNDNEEKNAGPSMMFSFLFIFSVYVRASPQPTQEAEAYFRGLFFHDTPEYAGAQQVFYEAGLLQGNPSYYLASLVQTEIDRPGSTLLDQLRKGESFYRRYYHARKREVMGGAFEKIGFKQYPIDQMYSELQAIAEEADRNLRLFTDPEAQVEAMNRLRAEIPGFDQLLGDPLLPYANELGLNSPNAKTYWKDRILKCTARLYRWVTGWFNNKKPIAEKTEKSATPKPELPDWNHRDLNQMIGRRIFKVTLMQNPLAKATANVEQKFQDWKQSYKKKLTEIRTHNRNRMVSLFVNQYGILGIPREKLKYSGSEVAGFAEGVTPEEQEKIIDEVIIHSKDNMLFKPIQFTGRDSDSWAMAIHLANWYDSALSNRHIKALDGTLTDRYTGEVITPHLANVYDSFLEEMSEDGELYRVHQQPFNEDPLPDRTLIYWSLAYLRWWGISQSPDFWIDRDHRAYEMKKHNVKLSDLITGTNPDQPIFVNLGDSISMFSRDANTPTLFRLLFPEKTKVELLPKFFQVPKVRRFLTKRNYNVLHTFDRTKGPNEFDSGIARTFSILSEAEFGPVGNVLTIESPPGGKLTGLKFWQTKGNAVEGNRQLVHIPDTNEYYVLFEDFPLEETAFRYRADFSIIGNEMDLGSLPEGFPKNVPRDGLSELLSDLRNAGLTSLSRMIQSAFEKNNQLTLPELVKVLQDSGLNSNRSARVTEIGSAASSYYSVYSPFIHGGELYSTSQIRTKMMADILNQLYGASNVEFEVLVGHDLINFDKIETAHSGTRVAVSFKGKRVCFLSVYGTFSDHATTPLNISLEEEPISKPILVRAIEALEASLRALDSNKDLRRIRVQIDDSEPFGRILRTAGVLLKFFKKDRCDVDSLMESLLEVFPGTEFTFPSHITLIEGVLIKAYDCIGNEIQKMTRHAAALRMGKKRSPYEHYLLSSVRKNVANLAAVAKSIAHDLSIGKWALSKHSSDKLWQEARAYDCALALALTE